MSKNTLLQRYTAELTANPLRTKALTSGNQPEKSKILKLIYLSKNSDTVLYTRSTCVAPCWRTSICLQVSRSGDEDIGVGQDYLSSFQNGGLWLSRVGTALTRVGRSSPKVICRSPNPNASCKQSCCFSHSSSR